jgi:RimJ/RimL family protein N-acetyltransferase
VTSLADGDIRLEPLDTRHGDAMDALARDEGVARFTRLPEPVPEGFGSVWVERYTRGRDEGANAGFAIVDSTTSEFLGFMALVKLDLETQEAEAGYIVSSRARGRGVATRALRLLTAWAFSEFPLERIELLIGVDNPASEVVAQRCGYTREGVLRWTYLKPGLRSDTIVYSMLRRELESLSS